MEKITIKIKREELPKLRIPVHRIKPEQVHKSKKDYNRKREKEELNKKIKTEKYED